MNQGVPRQYLETQILTAPKEELLLMLFDGAIRFCEQGKDCINEKDIEGAHNFLMRAQKIMLELVAALDKNALDEKLYKNLTGLYLFVYRRLVHANVRHDIDAIDEALKILNSLRQTWGEAVEKARQEGVLGKGAEALPGQSPTTTTQTGLVNFQA